jgi:hypothetical protein
MNKHKVMRAKQARAKHLRAQADAQAFNSSIWSTVAYRHGTKSFADHGKYYQRKQYDEGSNDNAETS